MTNKIKILSFIFLAATISWSLVIWSFSLKDAEKSDAESDKIVEIINETVETVFGVEANAKSHTVRKSAHFFEFALLGVLEYLTITCFGVRRYGARFALGAAAGLAVATIDEMLQLFSPGRSTQFSDVMLDFAGAMLAFTLCFVLHLIIQRLRLLGKTK